MIAENGEDSIDFEAELSRIGPELEISQIQRGLPTTTCLGRLIRPVLRLIDQPWKMYPVGLLFSLGFDTAFEITLLGVPALARGASRRFRPARLIILLPLLFTAGMTDAR